MKTAKVLEIVGVNKRTKGEHGPIYYITMKMDNNELITLGKKTEDAFKIGDTINYEVVEEGRKWKEIKENPFAKKQRNQESQNRGAMLGMSIKLAFEKVYQGEGDFEKASNLSKKIFELAMQLYNGSEDKKEEKADSDLPF